MPKRTSQQKPASPPREPARKIIDAALELAATRAWHLVSLGDIATAAEVPLADVYRHYPSKQAIVAAFLSEIDATVLAGKVTGDNVRERLFDSIMRRFDALAPHKAGLKSIARDLPRDPVAALCGAPRFVRSMAWMAEQAGVDTTGLLGALRVKGVAGVYLTALRTWFGDDTDDHSKTMATLDRALKRAEAFANSFPGLQRRHAS
jgi:AcrR family transcriptional regulator